MSVISGLAQSTEELYLVLNDQIECAFSRLQVPFLRSCSTF